MKKNPVIIFVLLLLILGCKEKGRLEVNTSNLTPKVKEYNKLFEQSLRNKDINSIIGIYEEKFTFMPEYKRAIFSKSRLKEFYKKWLDSVDLIHYKKQIYEIKVIDNHVLEIGSYNMEFQQRSDSIQEYKGKYLIVWKSDRSGTLKIVSEIFGSDVFLNPKDVPYSRVSVRDNTNREPTKISSELERKILELNENVIRNVEAGDGEARAKGFAPDGIYMPHFKKMLVGMDSIKPYMLKIYQAEALIYVSHNYYDIYDFKDFVLVNGHFKGGWGDSINGGTFEGNMSNLRKRTEDGQLLMYRQLTNNDR